MFCAYEGLARQLRGEHKKGRLTMGCGVFWQQVNEVEKALGTMRRFNIPVVSDAYQILSSQRTKLLGSIGLKVPRVVSLLMKIIGFSPGVIALWHDNESGFMSEARTTPSSPPVYKLLSGETAMKILTHDISPELEEFLMAPDEDQDN